MAHQTFKLRPGVETNATPVLNQAAISECNLIRFKPDPQSGALVEKLGGWTQYQAGVLPYLPSIPRSMWAWEDLSTDNWLAIGMEYNPAVNNRAILTAFSPTGNASGGPSYSDITPGFIQTNSAPNFTTTALSPIVTIIDGAIDPVNFPQGVVLTTNDAVYITVPVAVGGIILSGIYPIYKYNGPGSYQIVAHDLFGNAMSAISAVANGGVVPRLTTNQGNSHVNVHFPAHGLGIGSTFTILVATNVGDLVMYGDYTVLSVQGVDDFTIQGNITSNVVSATAYVNSGNVRYLYNVGGVPGLALVGYGEGGYGAEGYGLGQASTTYFGISAPAKDWALDNWGQILLANPEKSVVGSVPVSGIYQWTPNTGMGVAVIIPQAPTANDGFFVAMPQRQVVAWGSTFTGIQDPLLIRWCDVNDFNTWVGTVTNQAGSYRLPKGSKIVACLQSSQQAIIFTDLAVWSMQYISQPYIYSFNEISTGCGLIAQKACGTLFGVTYWMSQSQFFKLDGSGVAPIPCPVWDVVFQNLDPNNLDKIRFAPNSQFGEVAWHFPSKGGNGENDSYVKYHTILNVWDYSLAPLPADPPVPIKPGLSRSTWINQSVLGPPLASGPDPVTGKILVYQHETGPDAAGNPMWSWFKTGFFALSDADVKTFIDEIWPDMKWGYYSGVQSASVSITFGVKDYPSQKAYKIGPFTLNQNTSFISPRVRGRLVQIQLSSVDIGSFWRMGGMRYRGAPDGRY